MSWLIGIDVGGTFTDIVLLGDDTLQTAKSDTTHYDLRVGVLAAIDAAASKVGLTGAQVLAGTDALIYSTTVGTNALIERRGTRLGVITTHGFEDSTLVGRSTSWADGLPRSARYDRGRGRRPVPIVDRDLIVGALERVDNLGEVVMPLNEVDLIRKVRTLVDQGVRGLVVVTLNSFANPIHERRIAELIRSEFPDCYLGHLPVYLSSEISPQMDEYRRSMTVILDAYLREVSEEHLLRLVEELRDMGYGRAFFVAKNTGGISSLARTQALHLYGSGPAAAVIGAQRLRDIIDCEDVVIADMGGTSFDVGLAGAEGVALDQDPVIDRFRVQLPIVPHWSIGAGGGSIARVADGVLAVGPQSAGSNPGPACYGLGGTHPTVTDADVVLGFVNPDNFLGGASRLDAELARKAIDEHVAAPLGISVEEAAWQIRRLIDGIMGQEIYRLAVYRMGRDPRTLAMFAMGGAGPVHAATLAASADVRKIATFPMSSVFGAFSTLMLDIFQTYERTLVTNLYSAADGYMTEGLDALNGVLDELVGLAEQDMAEEGYDRDSIQLRAEAQMCYRNQRQTLSVAMPDIRLEGEAAVKALCDTFNDAYAARYSKGAVFSEVGIEILGVRVLAAVPKERPQLVEHDLTGSEGGVAGPTRPVYWEPETGFVDTPVHQRDELLPGSVVAGPALAEAKDTVIVVPPGWKLTVDRWDIGWLEKETTG